MTSKFEQLIEYVINDEEEKAKALFHDIVVEKSREIYENLMNEDTMEEECHHCHGKGCDECMMEEGMEDTSGDSSQDLMREVETEEEGMMEEEDAEEEDVEFDDEAEKAGEEETHDAEHDHDIEDRVVDLEDKLDELMAEFETLMGDEHKEHGDEMMPNSDHVGGDAYMDDDTSEFHDETMSENVDLKRAPAPVTTEPSFVNKKANYAVDSGARGMQGKPVRNVASEANPDGTSAYKAPTSYADKGRGDLPDAGKFKNVPATAYKGDLDAAPKPKFDQHNPNTRTPFPKG